MRALQQPGPSMILWPQSHRGCDPQGCKLYMPGNLGDSQQLCVRLSQSDQTPGKDKNPAVAIDLFYYRKSS
jgi:hypothetical protein